MAIASGNPASNRLVSTIGTARKQGRNLFLPICSQTALRPSFNQSRGSSTPGRDINEKESHQIALMRWLHQDTGCKFAYPCMDLNLEGGAVARKNGISIAFMDMGDDVALEVVPFLDENSAFGNLRPVDPMSDPLMRSRINFFRSANEDTVLRDLILSGWMAGPFTLAGKITRADALTALSMSAMADPESKEAAAFKACLDYATSTAKDYAKALEKAGAQNIIMLEPSLKWSNPFIFGEFIVPKINEVIEDLGIPVTFHACGDTSAFFEGIASVKAEGFSLDKEVDLSAMSALRPDALMIGNLDNTQMPGQPPSIIRKTAQEMIRRYAQLHADGLYLPATGCEITSPITAEQIMAFAEGVS